MAPFAQRRVESLHNQHQSCHSLCLLHMLINADFSVRASVTPDEYRWVASPLPGVERVMLDRVGAEKARATSIVRYAPGSSFTAHDHPGGEEILVLSGTFSEGDDHYPAGWYMRNPPGSSHQPSSEEGTTLFVKLWQMRPQEKATVRINTNDPSSWQRLGTREVCLLFNDEIEQVSLQRLSPGEVLLPEAVNSAECLVLNGTLHEGGQSYPAGSWIRLPHGTYSNIVAGAEGATVYLKTGGLELVAVT